jgi:protein-tyrosine phosphatase
VDDIPSFHPETFSTTKIMQRKIASIIPTTHGKLLLGGINILREFATACATFHIDHVVSCCNTKHRLDDSVKHTILGVEDNSSEEQTSIMREHLDSVVDEIHNSLVEGKTVAVHCFAGISRSPTVVIYYLYKHNQMSLDEAYQRVFISRPIIDPNEGFMNVLHDLVKK